MSEAEPKKERESTSWVLGIGLGLMLILGSLYLISSHRAQALDGREVLSEYFDLDAETALPLGFEVESASLLPLDDKIVKLVSERAKTEAVAVDAEDELETDETADASDEESKEGNEDDEWIDWTKVEELANGTEPSEVYFVFYPPKASDRLMDQHFRNFPRRGADDLGKSGGNVVIESGELQWAGFATTFVRQRRYRKKDGAPSFIDSLRVNLSVGDPCVMIAIWPEREVGEASAVKPILAALEPRS